MYSFVFNFFLMDSFQEDDDDDVVSYFARDSTLVSLYIYFGSEKIFFTHKLSLSSHLFCGVVFLSLVNLEKLIEIIFLFELIFLRTKFYRHSNECS